MLYHYTCKNAAEGIYATGVIEPRPQPELGNRKLIWLADHRVRTELLSLKLGLGPHSLRPACANATEKCDPIAVRFGVALDPDEHPNVHPFVALATDHLDAVLMYRAMPGAQPWRWWFATAPVRLWQLDRIRKDARV